MNSSHHPFFGSAAAPLASTLPGCPLPVCSTRPCGVGAGRRFSIIPAVF